MPVLLWPGDCNRDSWAYKIWNIKYVLLVLCRKNLPAPDLSLSWVSWLVTCAQVLSHALSLSHTRVHMQFPNTLSSSCHQWLRLIPETHSAILQIYSQGSKFSGFCLWVHATKGVQKWFILVTWRLYNWRFSGNPFSQQTQICFMMNKYLD